MTMTKNPQSLRSAVAASTAMLLPLVLCLAASAFAAQTSPATDSYLNAYSELQATKPTRSKSNDREYSVHQGIDFAAAGYPEGPVYRPEGPYPPSAPQPEYGAPQAVYGPPKPAYGPPHFEYGPPKPVYGPPTAPAYGPPKPIYGPPSHSYGFPPVPHYGPLYEVPHAMLGILDKLKYKLDLFTIGKIILKLVIFKKIVALIAILCLLLFLPSLKHKETEPAADNGSEEEVIMMRQMGQGDEKLNNVAAFVLESIESFTKKANSTGCDSTICKTKKKMLEFVDKKYNNKKLLDLYVKEL